MKLILFVAIVCFMLSGCLRTSPKKAVMQKTNRTETNSIQKRITLYKELHTTIVTKNI